MLVSRFRPVFLALSCSLASGSLPSVAAQGGVTPPCCTLTTPPGATCCIGQWEGPYDLGVSCADAAGGCPPCPTDEIAHAALIPTGSWPTALEAESAQVALAGQVVFWTRCTSQDGYTSHVWDPARPDDPPIFHPEILSSLNPNGASVDNNVPFCAGHVWVLDESKNPKLLTVGGVDVAPFEAGSPCIGSGLSACGLDKVYWFDPLSSSQPAAWSDAPQDLGDGRYYPSVTTYLTPDETQFLPLVVGGSWRVTNGCGGVVPFQNTNWWTLSRPLASTVWTNHGAAGTLKWQSYPRTFLLTNGDVLTAGSSIICETPYPGATHRYGGSPVRELKTSLPDQVVVEDPNHDPNPSVSNPTVGGWHYASGAILHTLNDFTYDEGDPVAHYDLDRVLMSGGSVEIFDDSNTTLPYTGVAPQGTTLEWHAGVWLTKSPPLQPRIFGNLVILPNRTLLAVGGANNSDENAPLVGFFGDAEVFDPGAPLSAGSWKAMAVRPNYPILTEPAPRGYHHVALLLPDGKVAVMGGALPDGNQAQSDGTVEIFKPPYTFESARPKITSTTIPDIHYGDPFCVSVQSPTKIDYAVLIGISSVTHHFDYGQRYVELMTTTNVTGCSGGNIKLLAPPLKRMAPEGYYLLYVVEMRGTTRVPSKGVFVKLY